jgi:mannose-6-phosphate isomerase-like protein (cupin superfamily)
VLQDHAGEARWRESIVADHHLRADYVQMAPGETTPTMLVADHRTSFIVWDGQIRFTIGGQEPFVASKGFMVQVPYRVPFNMEVVGDKPSLHFEVFNADATILYAGDETPPEAPEGTAWYLGRLQGQDTYEREHSVPYLDFFAATAEAPGPRGAFTRDDRSFLNIIRGQGIPRQPDTERGHFHVDYGEFWFIMEGQISYLIEGVPFFIAEPGDVVYAAPGRFHRAAFAGDGMSTRIAINGYPGGSHHFEPPH